MVFTITFWLPGAAFLLREAVGWKRVAVLCVVVASGVAIWVAASYLPEGKPCDGRDCADRFSR